MAIFDIIGPDWKQRITNQTILYFIIKYFNDDDDCDYFLLEKINKKNYIIDLINTSKSINVKDECIRICEKLKWEDVLIQIVEQDNNNRFRESALTRISNFNYLLDFVKKNEREIKLNRSALYNFSIRNDRKFISEFVQKSDDEVDLTNIIIYCAAFDEVKLSALNKIISESCLLKIIKSFPNRYLNEQASMKYIQLYLKDFNEVNYKTFFTPQNLNVFACYANNEDIQLSAIQEIDDEEFLYALVCNSLNVKIKTYAFNKIKNEDYFTSFFYNFKDYRASNEYQYLSNCNKELCYSAISKIENQETLYQIALSNTPYNVKAVCRLNNNLLLEVINNKDIKYEIKSLALKNISDIEMLIKILSNKSDFSYDVIIKNLYALNPTYTLSYLAENLNLLSIYLVSDMSLEHSDKHVSDSIINFFINKINNESKTIYHENDNIIWFFDKFYDWIITQLEYISNESLNYILNNFSSEIIVVELNGVTWDNNSYSEWGDNLSRNYESGYYTKKEISYQEHFSKIEQYLNSIK